MMLKTFNKALLSPQKNAAGTQQKTLRPKAWRYNSL